MSSTIKILGSGSSGNGYIINTNNESLVLELGLPFKKYLANIEDITSVQGCLVSHRHKDHFNDHTAQQFGKMGISVFAHRNVAENANILDKFNTLQELNEKQIYQLGGFKVQCISLKHSVPNFGFLIKHKDFGKLVFATDTSSFPYKMKGVNHWLLEANYDPDLIIDKSLSNTENNSHFSDHLSKKQCFTALQNNFDDNTKTIVLIHLSDNNSNAKQFKEELQNELCFSNIHVAGENNHIQIINLKY